MDVDFCRSYGGTTNLFLRQPMSNKERFGAQRRSRHGQMPILAKIFFCGGMRGIQNPTQLPAQCAGLPER